MPLEFTWPMTTSFAGVPSLQANGSSGLTGDASPSGVAGRLEIVPDPTGVRGNVMMSRLFETDAITASYLRSEIANDSSEFSEYWYSWKMMLGDDWGNFSEPFSLMQMHDTPDDGDPVSAPTFILAILSGHIRGIIPDQDLPTEGTTLRRVGSVKVEPMVWYDCCVHANWKKSGVAGFREFYIDGVPIWRQYGVVTEYDNVLGPFLKLGVYDGLSAADGWAQRTAYYSDIRVWSGTANHIDGMGRALAQPQNVLMI